MTVDQNKILKYYDDLATKYDDDRFENSYGRYIHTQETAFLDEVIEYCDCSIDLACGTGRFLDYVGYGLDISPNMVKVSQGKYPHKSINVGDATNIDFSNEIFDYALSFHLLMHLDKDKIKAIFKDVSRILKSKGHFVFDVPSKERRSFLKKNRKGWHGSNDLSYKEILSLLGDDWRVTSRRGILFLPIHRFPQFMRRFLIPFDNLLCRSMFKSYASYVIYKIEKK